MFDSIGWGEIIVLGLAALFIFGPERLPTLAKDAAAGLKRVREAITGVREQVDESLGDDLGELRDLDLRKYHPKTFIRDQLLGDDEPPPRRGSRWPRAPPGPATARPRRRSTPTRPDCRPPDDAAATVPAHAPLSPQSILAEASGPTVRTTCQTPRASASAAFFSRSRVSVMPCALRSGNFAQRTTASVTRSARDMSNVSVTVVPPSPVGASS